jgi:hypothetical protein
VPEDSAVKTSIHTDAAELASAIGAGIQALPVQDTPSARAVRRQYSRMLKGAGPAFILRLARRMCEGGRHHWFTCELIRNHRAAFERLDEAEVERLGQGINSWWRVDSLMNTAMSWRRRGSAM